MNLITRNRRHVPTPVVLMAIARSLLLVAAAAAGAGERKQPSGLSTQGQVVDTPALSVQMPDLNDPTIRQQCVESFAAGSFGITPQPSPDVTDSTTCSFDEQLNARDLPTSGPWTADRAL